ncbi:MAG: FtsX-like permease family protein, partial [Candidatus Baldrarchaeia archaeon]
FDGKDIEGAIALMDFNSGDNWINAARLGAKAVVFIAPEDTDYYECLNKFLDTPLYFPRLYVNKHDGYRLMELARKGEEVSLFVKMRYEKLTAYNVIGVVNGSEPNDVIIVAAHYDTWSVVPAVSYGANEATSVALLLELAKYFSTHKPRKTIWFVALSGHWEALAGAREFIERYYFSSEVQSGSVRPWLFLEIGPLSPDGKGLSLLVNSYFSRAALRIDTLSVNYAWVYKLINNYLREESLISILKRLTGKNPSEYVRDYFVGGSDAKWWGTEELPYMLASELVAGTGSIGFGMVSSFSRKLWRGTPLNDFIQVKKGIEKLKPQMLTVAYLIFSFAFQKNWESVAPAWHKVSPKRAYLTPSEAYGFITLKGNVLYFNLTNGWYEKMPHAIVQLSHSTSSTYPFAKIVTMADENGSFEVHGLTHSGYSYAGAITYSPGRGWLAGQSVYYWMIDAWIIDSKNGTILYAPDQGIYGSKAIFPVVLPLNKVEKGSVVITKVVPITIFDTIHPGTLRGVIRDQRSWYSYGGGEAGSLMPLEFLSGAELQFYGTYQNAYEPVSMIFVPKGSRIAITLSSSGSKRPSILIINASSNCPEGNGVLADKPKILYHTVYRAVYDMYSLAKSRYEKVKVYEVRRVDAENLLKEGYYHLLMAETFYKNRTYSKAYGEALIALSIASRLYNEGVMSLYDDVSNTCLFFFALLIMSSLLLESLIFHMKGFRRMSSTILVGMTLFLLFYFVHPALSIISSASMGIFGTIVTLIFVLAIVVMISEMEKIMKIIELKALGMHRVEVGKIGTVMISFSTSIEYMRKRPFRTSLTLLTIVSIITSMVSLTSMSYTTEVKLVPQAYPSDYNGILVMRYRGAPPEGPFQPYIIHYLKELAGDNYTVTPRVWYYPQSIPPNLGVILYIISQKDLNISKAGVEAALGLTPEESKSIMDEYSLAGFGFSKANELACILPEAVAQQLNVSVGNYVTVFGRKLLVKGIISSEYLDQKIDLDGYPITPVDPKFLQSLSRGINYISQEEAEEFPSLSWRQIIIIPYDLAMKYYGYISSVSIRPNSANVDKDEIINLAKKIALYSNEDVYLGLNGKVFRCSRITFIKFMGWQSFIPLLVLGGLNVTTTILSSIKERQKEISVFSSLGISPTGIMIMFFTESLIYALVGSAIGYFTGIALNRLFIQTVLLPKDFVFNFASVSIVLSLLSIIAFALISTIYPAYEVGKLVTPSLKRKWELPTKPIGNEWSIPLIIRISTREESCGILHFMKEYFEGMGSETQFYRVHRIVNFSIEDMMLELVVDLAPYERKVSQLVRIKALQQDEGYIFELYLKQISGGRSTWLTTNRYFVDSIRKQFLLWRTLPEKERQKHISNASGG